MYVVVKKIKKSNIWHGQVDSEMEIVLQSVWVERSYESEGQLIPGKDCGV